GTEEEKFGVHSETFAPLQYEGDRGVTRVFEALVAAGWRAEAEYDGGPLIALYRGKASITLEPGAQLELSGAPLADVHATAAELQEHLLELDPISSELGLVWLGVGFHPLSARSELPWVPKQRYAVMREYLPPLGASAHDMMQRTATIQVNFDYASEEDALRKLRVSLLLSPLVHAMTANSPFVERARGPRLSERGHVWLNMDRSRSGLIARVLESRNPRYADYAEWALDAGMFLFRRAGKIIANTGQSFRDFLAHGFEGHQATLADWKLHLNTLFPEVRLKNTLEVRGCDSLPLRLAPSIPALFTGLLYDATALAEAEHMLAELTYSSVEAARPDLVQNGLEASIAGTPARELAERLLEVSARGLERRSRLDARGHSERVYLEPLMALAAEAKTPANKLLDGLEGPGPFSAREIIQRTRIDL
ncbi:MAG TPA: glutamate-cysteine ligase family protein, partial [Polyangiaceae bacterium]|nr:glutamate-cysteine ligase family protein [Polyangiaceae bacterium]